MNPFVTTLAALTITLGIASQASISQDDIDPHNRFGRAPGCADLADYQEEINSAFADHELFFEVMTASDDSFFADLEEDEVEEYLDDGQGLLDDLDDLDVPAIYDNGHRGIRLLVQVNYDYFYFQTVDTTANLNIYDFDKAFSYIDAGELAAADACADEVDEIGGFIFFEPDVPEE